MLNKNQQAIGQLSVEEFISLVKVIMHEEFVPQFHELSLRLTGLEALFEHKTNKYDLHCEETVDTFKRIKSAIQA